MINNYMKDFNSPNICKLCVLLPELIKNCNDYPDVNKIKDFINDKIIG